MPPPSPVAAKAQCATHLSEVVASLRELHCNKPFLRGILILICFYNKHREVPPAHLLSSAPTMKTAASFWSFYSTVIAVVFQVKQCGITRDQRNANKETNRAKKKKKRPSPWTTPPPNPEDHLCSEQIQQVQKWQFNHVELLQSWYLFVSRLFHQKATETVINLGEK